MDNEGARSAIPTVQSALGVGSAELPALLTLLDARSGGAAALDPLGRIRWVTPRFRRFVAEPSETLTGREIRDFFSANEAARWQLAWRAATDKGAAETHLTFGRSARHRTGATLVRAPNGMLLVLDVPHTTAAEDQARQDELERLRELEQLRVQVLNTVAHEFATPLTPLRLQTAMLKNQFIGPLNERQLQSVEVLDRNMERLSQLVADVLDLSRLEAGKMRLEMADVDLNRIVHQTVTSVQPQAQSQGIELIAETSTPVEVFGDADRLTQVMFNLLSNAIKFTPRGGRIVVRLDASPGFATVSVEDTGRGIAADKMGRLFQPFSQIHDPKNPIRGGSGLGLSITHGIITQHGGRIWVESKGEGQGSKFSFGLPLASQTRKTPKGAQRITRIDHRGTWTLFYFRCPECQSRDIDIKIFQNQYTCNQCAYAWR